MKTRLLMTLCVSFAAIFFPIPAHAGCGAPPLIGTDYYNFEKASVVFVGTVTDIYNPHPEIHTGIEEYDTITFDVTRVLKGDVDDGTVTSTHGSNGYNEFEMGKPYLVYAFGGMRDISQCTSPILLSDESSLTIHEIGHYSFAILLVLVAVIIAILGAVIWRKRR